MNELLTKARNDFEEAQKGLLKSLASTPDEQLNWSPSETARSPLQIAAHVAAAMRMIHTMYRGTVFPVPTTVEADKGFREWEKTVHTREEVLQLLDSAGNDYLAWLETVADEELDREIPLPFGMGFVPLRHSFSFIAAHTLYHVAQIDYIQTIYGDHDWYL